ncbi:hypothetical protein B0H10DRAFT_1948810 [Mycena sp. CBHHK59/15]|nr:hypothetical protein B0H10DRAFT_1948810 [Mycena sp. CBHHK59/15]
MTPPNPTPLVKSASGREGRILGLRCSRNCRHPRSARLSASPQYFPIATSILGALDRSGSASQIKTSFISLLGWALNLFGSSVRLYCYRRLSNLFTFELSIRKNHELITTGIYSIVRHPSYTGAILSGIGAALCHLTPGSWLMECSGLVAPGEPWTQKIIPIWAVCLSIVFVALGTRMRKEDEMLKKNFGREWENWAAQIVNVCVLEKSSRVQRDYLSKITTFTGDLGLQCLRTWVN